MKEGLLSLREAIDNLNQEEGQSVKKLRDFYDKVHKEANEELSATIAKDSRLTEEGRIKARATGQDSFTHIAPYDGKDWARQGFDVRDPAIVVDNARIEAGLQDALNKLEEVATRLGVSFE